MQLFNTLTRRKEVVSPIHDRQIGLYACGPTVYSTPHIGNLRSYVFEDLLRRTLEMNGYVVRHVMNITDVGHLTSDADTGADKIEEAAKREHRSAIEISRKYEREFFDDLRLLNIEIPTKLLRATETIDLQIRLIGQLEEKDATYRTSDGVYFDTSKFPRYGQLGGQDLRQKKAGARVAVNTEKRQPTDFALWKFSRPDEKRQMEWPSPWGIGFPGWHIECSAMSMHELGEQFDIHCGGVDHIPVHHENEIAQSETATGRHPVVRIWIHGEHLTLPGKRMGKSEGNAITLAEVTRRGIHPLAFRYLCLQTHYRQRMSFSWDALSGAWSGLRALWRTVDLDLGSSVSDLPDATFVDRFTQAVSDDLRIPQALTQVHDVLESTLSNETKLATLRAFDRVLGIGLSIDDPHRPHADRSIPKNIQDLADERERSRASGHYPESDRIRAKILALGYAIDDTPDGPVVRKND